MEWTVDLGEGETPVFIPHAWEESVDVRWEGPAVYRLRASVPTSTPALRFHGVSYAAEFRLDGATIAEHRGIWDAFDVDLRAQAGRPIELEIRVTKNGGATYPVPSVASGFLPYVFQTFGGIFREVEWVAPGTPLVRPAAPSRVTVEGRKLRVDGRAFLMRGVLSWGWYPDRRAPHPDESKLLREARQARKLGFNLVKFCLWLPPHRMLEILEEQDLLAWIELPIWLPSGDPEAMEQMTLELTRIVEQYRHHPNVIAWTVGCELNNAPPPWREAMVKRVKALTGCPLVKDNSGGAEMYGGDPREFGDFEDFHPYGEPTFFPLLFDSLRPGPRAERPILLGETNDVDVHRDLVALRETTPCWASESPALNDPGVRWQYDLPRVLATSDLARDARRSGELMGLTRTKALWQRKFVTEAMRAREEIGGAVITGWADTPISTAGMVHDGGDLRFRPEEFRDWHADDVLFLQPARRPPWTAGGNRPGWQDARNFFEGTVRLLVGLATTTGCEGVLEWSLRQGGSTFASGRSLHARVAELSARIAADVAVPQVPPGRYELSVRFGETENRWPITVVPAPEPGEFGDWRWDLDPELAGSVRFGDGPGVITADLERALRAERAIWLPANGAAKPFWREAGYEFLPDPFWRRDDLIERWDRWLPIHGDRVLPLETLPEEVEVTPILRRIDVRTYAEDLVIARLTHPAGSVLAAAVRPFGGLGIQPARLSWNPSGLAWLRAAARST